jgi:COP9 signalosome complex subunit 4
MCQDEELELQYKMCSARILDAKRRFLDAATRYYELSQLQKRTIGGKQVCGRRFEPPRNDRAV